MMEYKVKTSSYNRKTWTAESLMLTDIKLLHGTDLDKHLQFEVQVTMKYI